MVWASAGWRASVPSHLPLRPHMGVTHKRGRGTLNYYSSLVKFCKHIAWGGIGLICRWGTHGPWCNFHLSRRVTQHNFYYQTPYIWVSFCRMEKKCRFYVLWRKKVVGLCGQTERYWRSLLICFSLLKLQILCSSIWVGQPLCLFCLDWIGHN